MTLRKNLGYLLGAGGEKSRDYSLSITSTGIKFKNSRKNSRDFTIITSIQHCMRSCSVELKEMKDTEWKEKENCHYLQVILHAD